MIVKLLIKYLGLPQPIALKTLSAIMIVVWNTLVGLKLMIAHIFNLYFFRAWFYCKACHESVQDENLIKKCKCKHCKFYFKYSISDKIIFDAQRLEIIFQKIILK